MEKRDEIYNILNSLGLEDSEITSINKRNKYLQTTTESDVVKIIDFFKIKCELNQDEIATLIIDNPLILSESLERVDILSKIYKEIGFSETEYKTYIKKFNKAFSLNPKEVIENIMDLTSKGKQPDEVKETLIKEAYKIFEKN